MAEPTPPARAAAGGEPTWKSDPTANVIALTDAAVTRLDDLREVENRCIREVMELRADYDEKLRDAESKRIDAIRAVDVGAVNRAAEVSATQAATLAAQVATSAETLRTQVQAAATASTVALAAALDPIQTAIADLRRAQYETIGSKAQVVETRGTGEANWRTVAGIGGLLLVAFGAYTITRDTPTPTPIIIEQVVPATTAP